MAGVVLEFGKQFFEPLVPDSHVDAILRASGFGGRAAVSAEADGVAAEYQGSLADVSDAGFFFEERVLAFGGEDGEEATTADVAAVGFAEFLASPAG